MFARVAYFFLLVALAGRVMAQSAAPAPTGFVMSVANGKYNISTSQLLNIPGPPPALTKCKALCDDTGAKMQACGETASCICRADTVKSLLDCEQCMFTDQIANNRPNTDFRIGSTPVLAAFGASCKAAGIELDKTAIALALPPTWDGPTGIDLGMPMTILGVIVAFFMVTGTMVMFSNI